MAFLRRCITLLGFSMASVAVTPMAAQNVQAAILAMDPFSEVTAYTTSGKGSLFRESLDGSVRKALNSPNPGIDLVQLVPSPADSNLLLVESADRRVFRSTDGGQSWKGVLDLARRGWGATPLLLRFDPLHPDRIIAGGSRLLTSSDLGLTWRKILDSRESPITSIELSRLLPQQILLGRANGTVDGAEIGEHFSASARWVRTKPHSGTVTNITFDAFNPGRVAIGYAQTLSDPARIYLSENYGGNWEQLPFPAVRDELIRSISFEAGNNTLSVSTRAERFVTNDLGGHWVRESSKKGEKWEREASVSATCSYDSRLRNHEKGTWDNYLDFGPGNHYIVRTIKGSTSNARSCAPHPIRQTSSLAPFLSFRIWPTGSNAFDYYAAFSVNSFGGSTYRQRAIYLDLLRPGYPGLVVALTQLGSSTPSCSATPLTTGLRPAAAANFDPRVQSRITMYYDYQNPNCSQSGNFQIVACGLGGGNGGDRTRLFYLSKTLVTCATDVEIQY
jgi:photosystem II stability/assembly factor-like uncharacterized protein